MPGEDGDDGDDGASKGKSRCAVSAAPARIGTGIGVPFPCSARVRCSEALTARRSCGHGHVTGHPFGAYGVDYPATVDPA